MLCLGVCRRQGKKGRCHHFPLPLQPNCQGDVIFPTGRCMDCRSVLRCKITAKFAKIQDKGVGFYSTLSFSTCRGRVRRCMPRTFLSYDGKENWVTFREKMKRMCPWRAHPLSCFFRKGRFYLSQLQPQPTLLLTSCLNASNCGAN